MPFTIACCRTNAGERVCGTRLIIKWRLRRLPVNNTYYFLARVGIMRWLTVSTAVVFILEFCDCQSTRFALNGIPCGCSLRYGTQIVHIRGFRRRIAADAVPDRLVVLMRRASDKNAAEAIVGFNPFFEQAVVLVARFDGDARSAGAESASHDVEGCLPIAIGRNPV